MRWAMSVLLLTWQPLVQRPQRSRMLEMSTLFVRGTQIRGRAIHPLPPKQSMSHLSRHSLQLRRMCLCSPVRQSSALLQQWLGALWILQKKMT